MGAPVDSAKELEGARVVEFPLPGEWVAVHTPASRIPSHGTDMLGQRYAFDFIRLDPRTRRYHPAGLVRTLLLGVPTAECLGWGEPIRAPLDGVVVEASDGMAEPKRIFVLGALARVLWNAISFRPDDAHVRKVVGNHVILDAGDGIHAVFAHLTTGSVAVEVGQAVRAGDLIGRVGHTGNSTAPHLHFQLMDRRDPLTAPGVPCAFRAYEVQQPDGSWRAVQDAIPLSTERIRSIPASGSG